MHKKFLLTKLNNFRLIAINECLTQNATLDSSIKTFTYKDSN